MRIEFPAKNAQAEAPSALAENRMKVLAMRYLKKDEKGVIAESPERMFQRVARNVAAADALHSSAPSVGPAAQEFYEIMERLEFLPNSPTLMNAGRDLQQLMACFVLPLEDSLDSIFETVKNAALIHKSGGGSGFSFSRIRPKGDMVRSTHGVSSGPVSFMRVFDAATDAVKQGGTRRGANMGVLRIDHPDILEFIDAKSGKSDLRNFNISVAVSDKFMEAVAANAPYCLVHPRTGCPVGHLNALEVFRRICLRAWEGGEPGVIFIDAVNRGNPTADQGMIECTNPCGEQPLLPYEACCLGSINLSKMVVSLGGSFRIDYARLAEVARRAVHFLDNVIDVNEYPMPQIAKATLRNRRIGLGIMGWSDLLIRLGIPYASEQALHLAEKVMGFVQRTAHRTSVELACRRGPYPGWRAGAQDRQAPRRNATVTTIAPTGTISLIAGCSGGIEPPFALSFRRKHILEGQELQEMHPLLLAELSERGLDSLETVDKIRSCGSAKGIVGLPVRMSEIYATALEISPEWHVRMQAAFQRHCDNAVSKTVNLPFEATVRDVESVYRLAYSLGCKGITVYRDRSRFAQVLNTGCTACA